MQGLCRQDIDADDADKSCFAGHVRSVQQDRSVLYVDGVGDTVFYQRMVHLLTGQSVPLFRSSGKAIVGQMFPQETDGQQAVRQPDEPVDRFDLPALVPEDRDGLQERERFCQEEDMQQLGAESGKGGHVAL